MAPKTNKTSPGSTAQNPLMPILNARVKTLVDRFAGGNVSKFVSMLNEGNPDEVISQQRFNRIFHIDKKTQKYPSVHTSITRAITNKFVNVSPKWLLHGEGPMLAGDPTPPSPFDADDPANVERAKIVALEKKLAWAIFKIYELLGTPRSLRECYEEIDNDTTAALIDLRRSGKGKV